MSTEIETEDTDIPTDDFGHPLTICTGCGQLAQCAGGKCWWCVVNEQTEQQQ